MRAFFVLKDSPLLVGGPVIHRIVVYIIPPQKIIGLTQ